MRPSPPSHSVQSVTGLPSTARSPVTNWGVMLITAWSAHATLRCCTLPNAYRPSSLLGRTRQVRHCAGWLDGAGLGQERSDEESLTIAANRKLKSEILRPFRSLRSVLGEAEGMT